MYKYHIAMSNWYNLLSCINNNFDMDVKYTGNVIQDLCEMRDLNNFELFDQLK